MCASLSLLLLFPEICGKRFLLLLLSQCIYPAHLFMDSYMHMAVESICMFSFSFTNSTFLVVIITWRGIFSLCMGKMPFLSDLLISLPLISQYPDYKMQMAPESSCMATFSWMVSTSLVLVISQSELKLFYFMHKIPFLTPFHHSLFDLPIFQL